MKETIIKSIEDILNNNYKINIEEKIADELFDRKEKLSRELLNKSTLAKILMLTNSIQDMLKKGNQESSEFKSLVDKLLKMDDALNRDEIINKILNNE